MGGAEGGLSVAAGAVAVSGEEGFEDEGGWGAEGTGKIGEKGGKGATGEGDRIPESLVIFVVVLLEVSISTISV